MSCYDENKMKFGCVLEGTKVRMLFDDIDIERVHVGDVIKSPLGRRNSLSVENICKGMESGEMIELNFGENSKLVLTSDHPVRLKQGFVLASQVEEGDEAMTENDFYVVITKKLVLPPKYRMVYNLSFADQDSNEDSHSFVAGGLVVGDTFLQRKYDLG